MPLRLSFVSLLACLAVAGCATKPPVQSSALKTAYAPVEAEHKPLAADEPVSMEPTAWVKPASPLQGANVLPGTEGLQGRTLTVGSLSDIRLLDKEVILTFDDGPVPGKTEKILDTLDRFHVKANFMMVGQMARAHPEIAREVAARGHAIGSHTFNHKNLALMNFNAALTEIAKGQDAVSKTVSEPVGFFRFPYLADTQRLRSTLSSRGVVVMDVDIDSKDYFQNSPDMVLKRTMALVHQRHKGIILMHDIHARTAAMLPGLLASLQSEGYKVVTLRYKRSRMPDGLLVASSR